LTSAARRADFSFSFALLIRISRAQISISLVVGPIFEEYVETNGLSDRLKFQPGDFFNEPCRKPM
jgi:hypothetical protein